MLNLGEVFIHGRSRAQAQEALDACRRLGISTKAVRTTDSGLVVPEAVWDEIIRDSSPVGAHF